MNLFRFLRRFKKPTEDDAAPEQKSSVDPLDPLERIRDLNGWETDQSVAKFRTASEFIGTAPGKAMDAATCSPSDSGAMGTAEIFALNPLLLNWYMSQGFIGYQACAIIAQHWLVDKACSQSGEDACRNGWEIKSEGVELSSDSLKKIRELDVELKVKDNLTEFNRFRNIFGIRVAIFVVESDDKDYYEKPFNIDGVSKGSYKGISQIDPYWMTPQLTGKSSSEPGNMHFYEPDYWIIDGKKYHRSHLVIGRGPQPADVLKPTYIFGGIPLTQRIYERVYAAERTANEAPLLAMSKRTTAIHVDLEKAIANETKFVDKIKFWTKFRDNYAVKVLGTEETMDQFDTNLSDFDSLIMNQYQLVAAIAKTPSTKLLGTSPKGFNATGEFESVSYHEELESIQEHVYDPFLERHYLLLAKSMELGDIKLTASWNSVDSISSKGRAELNKLKSEIDQLQLANGAISPDDVANRLREDRHSGYNLPDQDDETDPDDKVSTQPGMTPEALAELEKAGAQEEKAGAESVLAGDDTPVADNRISPEVAAMIAKLQEGLQAIDDHLTPEGKAIDDHKVNSVSASVEPSVKGLQASTVQNSRIVKDRAEGNPHKIRLDGMVMVIENPRGSVREGKKGDWRVTMPHHYGFIKGTKGADGDEVDCFVGKNLKAQDVFIVNQNKQDGSFDEHKCMIGFDSVDDARAAYDGSYSRGWTGFGSIHKLSMGEFRQWLKAGDTAKAFAVSDAI